MGFRSALTLSSIKACSWLMELPKLANSPRLAAHSRYFALGGDPTVHSYRTSVFVHCHNAGHVCSRAFSDLMSYFMHQRCTLPRTCC